MTNSQYYQVIDTASNTENSIEQIKSGEIDTIFRYYDSSGTSWKAIHQNEFNAIIGAGLSLCIFHEHNGTSGAGFGSANGTTDARYCRQYGMSLGQPAGSAIYFAVDYNPSQAEVNDVIVPYFQAAKTEMAQSDDLPSYKVAAYGSGLVCETLLNQGLAEFTCLSQSTGFYGSEKFLASGLWDVHQLLTVERFGLSIDPDVVNTARNGGQFGQFSSAA